MIMFFWSEGSITSVSVKTLFLLAILALMIIWRRRYVCYTLGLFAIITIFSGTKSDEENQVLPVVMWHGMGDTCCFTFSLGAIIDLLKTHLNGAYVKSLQIGGNIVSDYSSGFFMHPDKQIEYVCKQLANDEQLSSGYNAIGFSQGSQFLRAVAQRCPSPPMKTLISVGGQHQGIFGLPKCPSLSKTSCEYIRKTLNKAAYEEWVQRDFVQATYWHNPLDEDEYRSKSTFLSDINNELRVNMNYSVNLNKLTKFVMVKFLNDTIVQPKETQWFEFYKPGQDVEILPLKLNSAYRTTGLEQMDYDHKLHFLAVEGDHLEMKEEWFIANIIPHLL